MPKWPCAGRVYPRGRTSAAGISGHDQYRRRPTFGENNERTIESFILHYNQDIYGKDVKIEIIKRLRAEKTLR